MTTIMIILACGFYQILHVSVWLFIVMYALVRLPPPILVSTSSTTTSLHSYSIPAKVEEDRAISSPDSLHCPGIDGNPLWTYLYAGTYGVLGKVLFSSSFSQCEAGPVGLCVLERDVKVSA